ncbi:MAG: SpoIIIAH-like family protein [Bacilli bacterium]|nr:SpoIIIAH-like family protein [Bacilli bacterium]
MNKQNLWFLTLFSLILVLGIYYVTMPNELFLSKENKKSVTKKEDIKVAVKESNTLEAMRVSKEEERKEKISSLQKELTKEGKNTEEKNEYYEQLKYLNELQGKEENLEKKIKEKYNLDCFIKIDKENISSICISEKHDNKIANNIMRLIQEECQNKMYITVKFENK